MVVTLLNSAGHVLKDELNYEMLYTIFEKINHDLQGRLEHEKEALILLFKRCEEKDVPPKKAMIEHTERISSYTNTALFTLERNNL